MARTETGQKPRVTLAPIKRGSGPPITNETGATAHAEPKAAKHEKTPPIRGPPVELKAYTIPQFCEAYNLSIWTYYRIAKEGTGPQITKVGSNTLIGVADAEAWFEARKAPAKEQRRAREVAEA